VGVGADADALVTLTDPSGAISAAVARRALEEAGGGWAEGAAVALRGVSVFSPAVGSKYLNVLPSTVLRLWGPATRAPP
jgi:hypothetical protein